MRRLLRSHMPAIRGAKPVSASRVARMDGVGGRQHPVSPSAMPDACGLPPWNRSRLLPRLVLGHARHHRRCSVARRAARLCTVRRWQRGGDRVAQYCLLDALGCCAVGAGQARLAAQLLGAAETVRTEAGATLIATLAPLVARAEESAIMALGTARFEAEFKAGKGLRRDTAIRLALGQPDHAAAAASDDGSVAPLGKREADVARLVADGLSNKQIGARLFISERTVDSHVRSILNKLGFNSRAQIAGWMASSKQ